jgi:integrase
MRTFAFGILANSRDRNLVFYKGEYARRGKLRFHDLRHTCASLVIEEGESIKYIQTQPGHSCPTVTLNVYVHLLEPVNQAAACRLENAIRGAIGHKFKK